MLMADAIVLGPAILGFSGVVITGILRFKPANGFMPKTLCDERSGAILGGHDPPTSFRPCL